MNQVVRPPGQGISRNARRRRNVLNRIVNQEVQLTNAVSRVMNGNNNPQPGARTARNRRRRQRQRQNRRGLAPLQGLANIGSSSPWLSYFAYAESATLEDSVHKRLQTLYFPSLGLHRGLANSFTPTALAFVKGSIDVNITTTGTWSLVFTPNNVANSTGFIQHATGAGTTFANPYAASGPTITAGPYSTNYPGGMMRVVSASLQISPEGALLNQGGAGTMFYSPSTSALSTGNGTNWTRAYLDNLPMMMDWSGTQGIIMHWAPNDSEQGFPITATGAPTNDGACLGLYLTGIPANSAFRVEYCIGVEYVPNATYTNFVTKQSASIHPDTSYWTSVVTQSHWCPLMLSDIKTYLNHLDNLQGHSLGGYTDMMQLGELGASGLGDVPFDQDISVPNVTNAVVAEYSGGGAYRSALRGATNRAVRAGVSDALRYGGNYLTNQALQYGPSVGAMALNYVMNRYRQAPARIEPGAFALGR